MCGDDAAAQPAWMRDATWVLHAGGLAEHGRHRNVHVRLAAALRPLHVARGAVRGDALLPHCGCLTCEETAYYPRGFIKALATALKLNFALHGR